MRTASRAHRTAQLGHTEKVCVTPAVPENTSVLQAAATYNVALAPTLLNYIVQLHVYNMYTLPVWSMLI